jgi:molybdopterin synthase sulfur carrier subunit
MATVRLDGMLREFAPKLDLSVDAGTLGGVLDDLESKYPRLRWKIRDETGTVRRFVKVFVNGEELPRTREMETRIGPSDHIDILHSIQGG